MSHEWVVLITAPLCVINTVCYNVTGCEHLSGTRSQMISGSKLIVRSSFYGLLDILSGTELNPGQRETGRK